MVRKVVKIAVVISVINVLLAGMAFAEGVGLKLGKGEFHPSIGIVSEYDSNVLYKDADLISDFVLHVEPGFKLTMPGSNFIFDFSGLAVYNKYFKEENSVLSSTEGESGISITFNPRGQYKLKLSNNFIRSSRPRNHSLARNDRIANQAGFKFTYNPAGGILNLNFGYEFIFDRYDEDANLPQNNYMAHMPKFNVQWNFLPRTALVFNTSLNTRNYYESSYKSTNPYSLNSETKSEMDNPNPTPYMLLVNAGMIGQVTRKISVTLLLGYGNTMISGENQYIKKYAGVSRDYGNFNSALATLELNYKSSEIFVIKGGITRTAQLMGLFGYFEENKLYFNIERALMHNLWLRGNVSFSYNKFGESNTHLTGTKSQVDNNTYQSDDNRIDPIFAASVDLDYQILTWLAFNIQYNLINNSTGYQIFIQEGKFNQKTDNTMEWVKGNVAEQNLHYFKNEVLFKISVSY